MSSLTLATLGNQVKVEFFQAFRRYEAKGNNYMKNAIAAEDERFIRWARAVRLWDEYNPLEARLDTGSICPITEIMLLLKEQLERLNDKPAWVLNVDIDGPEAFVFARIQDLVKSISKQIGYLERTRKEIGPSF